MTASSTGPSTASTVEADRAARACRFEHLKAQLREWPKRRRLIGFEPAPEPPFTTSRHYAITQPEPAKVAIGGMTGRPRQQQQVSVQLAEIGHSPLRAPTAR